jgi:hypothetical protein
MAKRQGIRIIKVTERNRDSSYQIPAQTQDKEGTKNQSRQMAAVISTWVREIQGRPVAGGKSAFHRLFETPATCS